MLPDASLGGGGNGDGSLVAVAVVVNNDDTMLDVPAGRAKIDDLQVMPQQVEYVAHCGFGRGLEE